MLHWWSTLAPSSSTSRLTSFRRSGFAWSVCTPFAVSVVSITYFGIRASFPPCQVIGRASLLSHLHAGGLVVVEECAAEEEERRHDQVGEENRHAGRLFAPLVQQEPEHRLAQEDDDHDCRERTKRVDVV